MGTLDVVTICGVLPTLWVWLLCSPKRATQSVKMQAKAQEPRDWRDDLDWRR